MAKPTSEVTRLQKELKDWISIAEDNTAKLDDANNRYEQTRDELVKAEKTIESLIYQRAHLIALINILTKGK
jgi:hypothetical protein